MTRRTGSLSFALWLSGWLLCTTAAAALTIEHVKHRPAAFDPEQGESATISFSLSEPAEVEIHLYDGRDLLVRSLEAGALPAGAHHVTWDGAGIDGRPVPPEAYRYSIEARSQGEDAVIWDVSDVTGSDKLSRLEVDWDPETGTVQYLLDRPSRVRIRIGLQQGGPLLRTLLDWVPRGQGSHTEHWDGWDQARAIELGRHPRLEFMGIGFPLSRNTLLVTPAPREVRFVGALPSPPSRRVARPRGRRRMVDYAHQRIEDRRDFPIRASLPAELALTGEGLPIVEGKVPLRVDVDAAQRAKLLGERFEASFFVDGQFISELEAAFLPLSWSWNAAAFHAGLHYLTVNLRSYEGHFGVTTVKVMVRRPEAAVSQREQQKPRACTTGGR